MAVDPKPDVFFAPAHYTPPFLNSPLVVTIHDTAYEYFPNEFRKQDLYQLRNWTKSSVDRALKIIAVSKNTKKDIIDLYKAPDNKINVIYNGFARASQSVNSQSKINSITKVTKPLVNKFILYVGTLQPRKNILTLIDAFHLLKQERNDKLKLVIVGKKGWLYDKIFTKVNELNLQDEIIFKGFVSDSELINIYQRASVFVLPSFYEGFGIPILEAMSYDCPVICSETSALPEVGGNACLYFNPHDKIDLAAKIKSVLADPVQRVTLIRKGREQIKKFSWKKCGEETYSLLTKVGERDFQ